MDLIFWDRPAMVRPKTPRALSAHLDSIRKQKKEQDVNSNGRFSSGQRAFIEIRYYSHSTTLQIPHAAAQRLVKDICQKISTEKHEQWQRGRVRYIDNWEPPTMYRMETQALACLHEAMEGLIVAMMEEMNYVAIHARRVTIMPKDLQLVSQISGTNAYQGYGLHRQEGSNRRAQKRKREAPEPPAPEAAETAEAEVPERMKPKKPVEKKDKKEKGQTEGTEETAGTASSSKKKKGQTEGTEETAGTASSSKKKKGQTEGTEETAGTASSSKKKKGQTEGTEETAGTASSSKPGPKKKRGQT